MLTSNQRYRGLNRRFDRRAGLLKKLGFKYISNEFGAFFTKGNPEYKWSFRAVPAAVLSLADNVVWIDKLKQILK